MRGIFQGLYLASRSLAPACFVTVKSIEAPFRDFPILIIWLRYQNTGGQKIQSIFLWRRCTIKSPWKLLMTRAIIEIRRHRADHLHSMSGLKTAFRFFKSSAERSKDTAGSGHAEPREDSDVKVFFYKKNISCGGGEIATFRNGELVTVYLESVNIVVVCVCVCVLCLRRKQKRGHGAFTEWYKSEWIMKILLPCILQLFFFLLVFFFFFAGALCTWTTRYQLACLAHPGFSTVTME